jgi:ABC-type antimicrobial peptide transport system permease subunit
MTAKLALRSLAAHRLRLGLTAVAVVLGVVAAIWPARRAARMDVLRAIGAE